MENFFDAGLEISDETMIATIGPITSAALVENGYEVDAEAVSHDIPGLIEAVLSLAERLG